MPWGSESDFDKANREAIEKMWRETQRRNQQPHRWELKCVNGSCGMTYVSDRPHYGDKCPRCGCVMNCQML